MNPSAPASKEQASLIMNEREAIVAWLRAESRRHQSNAKEYSNSGCTDGSVDSCLGMALTCLDNAAAIERGGHLPLPPRQTAVPDEKD